MFKKERKIKFGKSSVTGASIWLCRADFNKVVEIPEGISNGFVVFDKVLTDDGFRIKPPCTNIFSGKRLSKLTRVKRHWICAEVRGLCGRAYDAGYRAVHIEYDEVAV